MMHDQHKKTQEKKERQRKQREDEEFNQYSFTPNLNKKRGKSIKPKVDTGKKKLDTKSFSTLEP